LNSLLNFVVLEDITTLIGLLMLETEIIWLQNKTW